MIGDALDMRDDDMAFIITDTEHLDAENILGNVRKSVFWNT